jgi:AcrR family transcriptional regulator
MTDQRAMRRRVPAQGRSRETFEAICAAAGEIIAEHGITALNTNAVARHAGVSITAVYAYFPDKWAIVGELFDRSERLRSEYLEGALEDLRLADDWRLGLTTTWRALVRFRVEVPGGVALRKAVDATPRLGEIDREGSERAARDFAVVIQTRRPDIGAEDAYRVAWAATIVVASLLDDVCVSGVIDEVKFDTAVALMLRWFAPFLDPA